MIVDAIDHAIVLSPASEPFERLGLALTPWLFGRRLLVGGDHNRFHLHLLEPASAAPLYPHSAAEGPGLSTLALRTTDLGDSLAELGRRGVSASPFRWTDLSGAKRANGALLQEKARLGADVLLVQDSGPPPEAAPRHALPLRRLDHLAILADDLDARTRDWAELLGVRVSAEVRSEHLLIRQLKIGDAVLELLYPAHARSPLAGQPPGLRSVASFQVDDLDDAVEHARARGFRPTEPGPGPLPATRIATIPADQMAGLNLQLLQHLDSRGPEVRRGLLA